MPTPKANPKLQVKRDRAAMESRRREALSLLESGVSQSEVSRQLGVTRQAISLWVKEVRSGGRKAIASKGKPGRKTAPSSAERRKILSVLSKGPVKSGYRNDLWTLRRIAEVIATVTGRKAPSTTRTWMLLGEMGWSCQRPARRARQRDEEKIAAFREQTWVELKKTPESTPNSSSSQTKAD